MSDLEVETGEYQKHLHGAFEEIQTAVLYAQQITTLLQGMAMGEDQPQPIDLWKIAEMILARADYTHQGEEGSDISLDDLLSH